MRRHRVIASAVALLIAAPAVAVAASASVAAQDVCTTVGTTGPDVLRGTAGDDVICGRGGKDVLRGRGGDDVLKGGRGADKLYGGRGGDHLDGGPRADLLACGRGTDTFVKDRLDEVRPSCETAPPNQAPTRVGLDPGTVPENSPDGALVGRFVVTDPDPGDTHTFDLVGDNPDNAFFRIDGDLLRTTRSFDYETWSSYSVTVRATDSGGLSATRQLAVVVLDVAENRAPSGVTLSNDSVPENSPAGTTVGQLAAQDDPGDTVTFTLPGSDPDNAFFTLDGDVLKTAAPFDFETRTSYAITVAATDQGGLSDEKPLLVHVTDVDDGPRAPVARADTLSTDEDVALLDVPVSQLLSNDTDANGDPLTVTSVSPTVGGTVVLVGSTFSFRPQQDFCGATGFSYTVSDGALTDIGTVSVHVACVNDAPVAQDQPHDVTGNVRIQVAAPGLLTGAGDVDSTPAATPDTGSSAQGGTFSVASDGAWSYNPPAGYEGPDSFTFQVCDGGTPDLCDSASVDLTVKDMIWFVDNGAASPGDGRLGSPFPTLGALAAVNDGVGNHPAAGDTVFLDRTTSTPYAGPLTLLDDQLLIGKGATAGLAAVAGITPAPDSVPLPATGGTKPEITSGGNGVALAKNNVLRGFSVGDTTGTGIRGVDFGSVAVREVSVSTTGAALSLAGGTFVPGASFDSVSSSGGTANIALQLVNGDLSIPAGHLTGADQVALLIRAGSGSISYGGSITYAGSSYGVNIQSRTGGTVTLSGPITETAGAGIGLFGNAGATVKLTGKLSLVTGSGPAFTATGGGTVEATGAGSTLTTTTGTPLTVDNTTVGPGGLTFQSITSNGAPSGIVLSHTGSGSVDVTGDGSNAPGSGGTINASTGAGIAMDQARLSLVDAVVQRGADDGVRASGNSVLELTRTTVFANGNALGEYGLDLAGLTGTATLQTSVVQSSYESNVRLTTDAGSPVLEIRDSTVSFARLNAGLVVGSAGTASTTVRVIGSTLFNVVAMQINGSGLSSNSVELRNNTLTGYPGTIAPGVYISSQGEADTTFSMDNNVVKDFDLGIIASSSSSGADSTMKGTVTNNVVTGGTRPVNLAVSGLGQYVVKAAGNTITGSRWGISVANGQGAAALDATVVGNTISMPTGGPGVLVQAGNAAPDSGVSCAEIATTSVTGPAGTTTGVSLTQTASSTIRLPGYAGGARDVTAVQSFVSAKNGGTTTTAAAEPITGGGFTGGAACTLP